MIIETQDVHIETSRGPMRAVVMKPAREGRYPGVIAFSEIFQLTGPVLRLGAAIAGRGYLVVLPEIFHEFEPSGSVLPYTPAGTDRGNELKISKELASYDEDVRALCRFIGEHPASSGSIGTFGVCIGGHLAFRAALNPSIDAAACMYATDIHKRSLGKGQQDDTLARIGEIKGELLLVWGRQDPHIPDDGRQLIHRELEEAGTTFTWHEFNAQHAFMRDEGPRYDPELAATCFDLIFALFRRTLR
jgi:carboxymethylenebutenolidase